MFSYGDENDTSYYGNALICENGHLITTDIEKNSNLNIKYCKKCGAKTLKKCPECGAFFHGQWYGDIIGHDGVNPYCYECGKPYPWTQFALDALKELIDDDTNISSDEKEKCIDALPALLSDTPRTKVATSRLKNILGKVGKGTAEGIKEIIINVASDFVKKSLGL